MTNLTQYFTPGPQGTIALKAGTNFSYKGDHLQVYEDTEIDRWFVGSFSSATYFITVEFDSNQKETLQVLVVARPDHASFTVYGRTSVDNQLITISAEVNSSWLSLRATPADPLYAGSRISVLATYAETMLPLTRPTAVGTVAPGGSGGTGGTAPPPLPGGGTGSGVSIEVSDIAPAATETGSLWFNSNTGELFVYYKDGTSDQWVQPASGGDSGSSGVSQTYVDTSINTIVDSAPSDLDTLGKLAQAMNNDPLFLTTLNSTVAGLAPAANPTFTGTVTGINAAMVGLGNVTNESKATMFNNPTFTGTVTGISAGSEYTLPASNTIALGGVIVPAVTTSGLNNTSGSITLATASTTQLGGVKVDGTSITITSGIITVPAVATIGLANGVATLGTDGKLSAGQIPSSLTGAVVFKGTWNASTNSPTLIDGTGSAGWQYAVNTSGTRDLGSGNITFAAGDYIIYNGTIWQKIPAGTIAAAGTLTGTTINATVVTSSLTSVGVLTNLTVTNAITGSITGNAGTSTNGVVTTGTYSDPTWLTISKSKVGLSNVDNTTDAGKPISTLTQTALDLKSPKADPTFTGTVTLQQITEVLNIKTSATGTVTHDLSTGSIFYHSSISANFTANFTNVPTPDNRTLAVVLVLNQGVTAYLPTVVQIDGVAQTIFWQGATLPIGTANRVDVVSVTLIRSSSAWTVIGALTTYGAV